MLSPELHPPTPGNPFLIDTPRAPEPPLPTEDDPTPFSDVLQEKSEPVPAPEPDPTDDAPEAQDLLDERESGAELEDDEPEAIVPLSDRLRRVSARSS